MWPRRFLSTHRPARRHLHLAIAAGAVAAALFTAWTLVLALTIAAVFIDGRSLADERAAVVVLLTLLVVRSAALAIVPRLAGSAAQSLRSGLRSRLLPRALRTDDLDGGSTTELATLIGSGVDALDDYTNRFLPALALAGIVPVGVFLVIGIIDPWSTLVLLLAGPLLVALLAVIGRRTRELADARFEELAWLGALYADMLQGIATLKSFGREQDALTVIEETSTRFGRSTMKVLRTAFQTSLVIEWAATAATALVAVEVSLRLIEHRLGFAPALAVLMLTPEFFTPLRTLASEYHAGQSGAAAVAAIDAFLDTTSDLPAPTRSPNPPQPGAPKHTAPPSTASAPHIEFDGLDFHHRSDERYRLDRFSLDIAPGETVALVGPSGSGKSTIAALLLGFESPDAGSIRIDGEPLERIDPAEWRRRIAWVPQHPTILSGSIADNIRLGRPEATDDEVRAAITAAQAHRFIDAMPAGLDTVVGERGTRLSGGERRRIALARALLVDTPALILDEFTAHLDPTTEAAVLDAVGPLLDGRTMLLITHRSAVLRIADRVVPFESASAIESTESGR